MKFLERYDFGVFVFSPGDEVSSRDRQTTTPRTNVVFELGLFMGRLGRDRCFIVCERALVADIFSDLKGITFAEYTAPTDPSTISAAVETAGRHISRAIADSGPRRDSPAFLPSYLRPLVKDGFTSVLGSIRTSDSSEPTGLIGLGDAIGLADIRTYFDTIGIREFPVRLSEFAPGETLRGNLLLLGGPSPNAMTREVLDNVRTNIEGAPQPDGTFGLRDRQTGITYMPAFSEEGRIQRDVGVIISSPNPFDAQHRSIVIYGITGYGTWAAARFFASDELHAAVGDASSFEVALVCDIVRDTPHKMQAVVVRELPAH